MISIAKIQLFFKLQKNIYNKYSFALNKMKSSFVAKTMRAAGVSPKGSL